MKNFCVLVLCLLTFQSIKLCAFERNFMLGLGIASTNIPFNDISARPMYSNDEDILYYGGSFNAGQNGIDIRATFSLDDDFTFRVPFGLRWSFYSGNELVYVAERLTRSYKNHLQVVTPYLGFEWAFFNVPVLNARVYTGVDFSPSFITAPRFRYEQRYLELDKDNPLNTYVDREFKSDVWRFSFMPKVGVEGELSDNIYINASVGFQTLNLLGRDNRRGELLTPLTDFETQESLVRSFVFSFMLQYHFK